jgi:hypothetical protein
MELHQYKYSSFSTLPQLLFPWYCTKYHPQNDSRSTPSHNPIRTLNTKSFNIFPKFLENAKNFRDYEEYSEWRKGNFGALKLWCSCGQIRACPSARWMGLCAAYL